MLTHSGTNRSFLCEAVGHAADLHDQTGTPEFKNRALVVALLGSIPDNLKLIVFGCVAFVQSTKKFVKII